MIKKLRLKFIAISFLSLFIVLFVIVFTINFLNYRKVVEDADHLLSILESNDGMFPETPKAIDKNPDFFSKVSPEARFESRYFSVLMDDEGSVISVDTGKIASIDKAVATDYAETLFQASKVTGFISDYRYVKQDSKDGMRIIFLYCEKSLSNFRFFLAASVLVSTLGMLSVMVLVTLLSNRIIKPVSESYEKQKQFITDAGHEIKTPLTIIDADLSVLEMEYGENEWISDIYLQTQRLTDLTRDLIYLSRMEEGQHDLPMIDFPLSDILLETAHSFQSLAKIQKKTFTVQVQPLLSFCGDEKSIRQLISILLENALKYSDEQGHITLSAEQKGKTLHIYVENTSTGISPQSLPHLFDRFYRTDVSRNSETGGYGIGLSIAKAIVLAHRGKITACSPNNESLRISVTL